MDLFSLFFGSVIQVVLTVSLFLYLVYRITGTILSVIVVIIVYILMIKYAVINDLRFYMPLFASISIMNGFKCPMGCVVAPDGHCDCV